MYSWLWRHLPGPLGVRVVIVLLLFLAVVAVLFLWVFPWVETRLPFTDVTVDEATAATHPKISGLGWRS